MNKEVEFTFSLEGPSGNVRVYPDTSVGGIKALYRGLRENYEYWLRHEEANQVYWREMEIQRNHREVAPRPERKGANDEDTIKSKKNGWIRRNFSLTALYRRVSNYGMNYLTPIFIAAAAIALPVTVEVYQLYTASLPQLDPQKQSPEPAVQQQNPQNETRDIPELATERLAAILGVKPEDLMGYFARVVAFSIVGVLAISALKNKFERKSRK